MAEVELLEDPAAFLEVAGPLLAADPLISTVVSGVTVRARDEDARGVPRPAGVPRWWAVVRKDGTPVGAAMRTAPFRPHPLFVLPMPDDGARALARLLHERGEEVGGVNGALPAARVVAEEAASLVGGTVEVEMHTRLFELAELAVPPSPPGALRRATVADLELVVEWSDRFVVDADAQAGRSGGTHDAPGADEVARAVERGTRWLWVDEEGRPVHLTGGSEPAFGVSRIGPVYTPPEHRGRGYAAAAVAEVSRMLLDRGARVCLFTDQANPTSNALYERLGYRPVVDMVNLLVRPGRPPHRGPPGTVGGRP